MGEVITMTQRWSCENSQTFIFTPVCVSLSLCVVFRAAGIRQAASWVKESWRRGGELYWSSWMPPDDHMSLYWYTYNMHSPPSSWLSGDWVVASLSGIYGVCETELKLIWWLIWVQETDQLINLSLSGCLFVAFVSCFFLVDCSCTCFSLPIIFILN